MAKGHPQSRYSFQVLTLSFVLFGVLALAACSGSSGNSSENPGLPLGQLRADQEIFENTELHGGEFTVSANFPFGGGNFVSQVNYIFSVSSGGLSKSPSTAGPQTQLPAIATLDGVLPVPALSPTRILQGGQVWLLPAM